MRKHIEFHPNKTVADEQLVMLRKPVTDPNLKILLGKHIFHTNRDFDGDFIVFDGHKYFVDINNGVFEEILD